MSTTGTSTMTASNRTAPTQFLEANGEEYAYRSFGQGRGVRYFFFSTSRERLMTGTTPLPSANTIVTCHE
jgi:hypothetical protein